MGSNTRYLVRRRAKPRLLFCVEFRVFHITYLKADPLIRMKSLLVGPISYQHHEDTSFDMMRARHI